MRLYDFERAPNPRRVRIFVAEKGVDIPKVQVNLFDGEQLSPKFRAINPGAMVPVLETDDGVYLSECIAICKYIEALHPEPNLFGEGATAEALVLMWNNIVENEGMFAIAEVLRNRLPAFENRALPGPVDLAQIPELVERGCARCENLFDRIDQLPTQRTIDTDDVRGERVELRVQRFCVAGIRCDGKGDLVAGPLRHGLQQIAGEAEIVGVVEKKRLIELNHGNPSLR